MSATQTVQAGRTAAVFAAAGGRHGPLTLWRRWRARRARALPAFFIIGTQKGGTTSLYRYLGQHPQVVEATRKEVHYFDINFHKGERWYRSHFPQLRLLDGDRLTGEASPYYMCHPHAPARIAQRLPDARLIVLLRNPVERAISHYFHSQRNGREPLSITDAMAAEDSRIAAEYRRMVQEPNYVSRAHRWYSYQARGRYLEQLQNVLREFPREQVLILRSEDLFQEPARTFDQVCAHLGIRTGCAVRFEAQLVGGYNARLAEPVRESLRRYFAPHNEALADFLKRDLGWE